MRATALNIYTAEQLQGAPRADEVRAEIEFRGVTKRFPAKGKAEPTVAVNGLDFSIRRGEIVSIIGPSGCGKSTLLNMGSGLYMPSEGEVYVGGERVNLDVLDAEQQFHGARRDLAEARYGYLRAWLQLRYLAGQLNEADLTQLANYFVDGNS